MAITKKIPSINRTSKVITALLMCCCLVFLTGMNFIAFPQTGMEKNIAASNSNDEKDPSAPVEEKAGSNTSVSVQEEYLHEKHSADEFVYLETLSHNKLLAAEKLQVVHFELISPPPEA